MKTNNHIGLILAGLIAIVAVGTGCSTTTNNVQARPNTYGHLPQGTSPRVMWAPDSFRTNFPNLAGIAAATNTPPAAATTAPSGVVIHQITNATPAVVTNGMTGGASCLFVNKTDQIITVSATSVKTKGTFTLELKTKSNRTFNILPGEYEYTWTVGESATSYPITGPATLTVSTRPIHLYDGLDGVGNYNSIITFKIGK